MHDPAPRLYIISGAGLSASSGIPTFRTGEDALWEGHDPEVVCNIANFESHYEQVWDFYNARYEQYAECKPNLAHEIMVDLENEFPGRVQHITTNIDTLLETAGAQKVHHVHGRMDEVIRQFDHNTGIGQHVAKLSGPLDLRNYVGEIVKPNVVFFGECYLHKTSGLVESLYTTMYQMLDMIREQDVIVLVGASNQVVNFHHLLENSPAYTININPYDGDDEEAFRMMYYFNEQVRLRGPAGMKQVAPRIRELMNK